MANINRYGTYTLTNGTITIVAENGLTKVAMRLISGSATYKGELQVGTGNASTAIPLVVNDPVSIGGNQPINYLLITATVGVVEIIASDGQ